MSEDKPTNPEALRPSGTVPSVDLPPNAKVPRELRDSELRSEFLQSVVDAAAEKAARRTADYFNEESKQHQRKVEGYLQEHRREALARVRADEARERRFDVFCGEVRNELQAINNRLERGEHRFERNEIAALVDRERNRRVLETVSAIKLLQDRSQSDLLKDTAVLVVEDEPEVRNAIVRVVGDAGGRSIFADSIEGARALLDPPPDVCIVDMSLRGGEDGMRLVRELRLGHGGIGVVIASGNVDAAVREEARELDVAAVLHKPFDSAALLSAVQEARDAARAQGA